MTGELRGQSLWDAEGLRHKMTGELLSPLLRHLADCTIDLG
jgi:hypothetical protein